MFRKKFLWLLALLVFSILLMTVQVKLGPFNPLRFFSFPLNGTNALIHRGVLLAREPFRILKAAISENAELTSENAELKRQIQELTEIKAENRRLRSFFELKERQPSFVAVAHVISRGADQGIRSLVIDKGSSDGIEDEMIAITPDGLAGKVSRTWPGYSEILLITDSNFSVSVRLQESRVEGILTGTGRDCRLNYIMNEVEIKNGDTLITSGLDRFYPEGIPVGKVRSVQKTTPELFQNIGVEPASAISKIEEVMIIHQ